MLSESVHNHRVFEIEVPYLAGCDPRGMLGMYRLIEAVVVEETSRVAYINRVTGSLVDVVLKAAELVGPSSGCTVIYDRMVGPEAKELFIDGLSSTLRNYRKNNSPLDSTK